MLTTIVRVLLLAGLLLSPWVSILAQPVSEPSSKSKVSQAFVVVYRLKAFAGSALKPTVHCDDVEMARLQNGRYFSFELPAGKHVLHGNRKQDGVVVNASAGSVYYVRVDIVPPGFMGTKGNAALALMPKEVAERELGSLKPSDSKQVKDKSRVLVDEYANVIVSRPH